MPEQTNDFIPGSYGDLEDFFDVYGPGLTKYGLTFGLTLVEIDANLALINKCIADHTDSEAAKAASKAATAKFKLSRKDAVTAIRSIAKRIKPHPGYTEEIGKEMGIVGEESTYNPEEMKPELKVVLDAGIPMINFVKSYSDGVNIYSKRGDETEFTFLARDTVSPYLDNRPNLIQGVPEIRRYNAYYIFKDEEHGFPSDIVQVTVRI